MAPALILAIYVVPAVLLLGAVSWLSSLDDGDGDPAVIPILALCSLLWPGALLTILAVAPFLFISALGRRHRDRTTPETPHD